MYLWSTACNMDFTCFARPVLNRNSFQINSVEFSDLQQVLFVSFTLDFACIYQVQSTGSRSKLLRLLSDCVLFIKTNTLSVYPECYLSNRVLVEEELSIKLLFVPFKRNISYTCDSVSKLDKVSFIKQVLFMFSSWKRPEFIKNCQSPRKPVQVQKSVQLNSVFRNLNETSKKSLICMKSQFCS